MNRLPSTWVFIGELCAEMSLSPTLNRLHELATELAVKPRETWRAYVLEKLIPEQVR